MKVISLFILMFLLGCATQTSSSGRGIASLPSEESQPAQQECMHEKSWQEYYKNEELKYAPNIKISIKESIKISARKNVSETLEFTNFKCHFRSQDGRFSDSESLDLESDRKLNYTSGPDYSHSASELGSAGYYYGFATDLINGKKSRLDCMVPTNVQPTVSQFFTALTKYFNICVPEPKKVELETDEGNSSI